MLTSNMPKKVSTGLLKRKIDLERHALAKLPLQLEKQNFSHMRSTEFAMPQLFVIT